MMRKPRTVVVILLIVALLVIAAACGEDATPAPTASDSPIEFVMEDNYALGQEIEIKIRNNGTGSYVYSEYYPACNNLNFYDESEEARQLETLSEIVELSPGLFIIPEGTHCDIANESQIKPDRNRRSILPRECTRSDPQRRQRNLSRGRMIVKCKCPPAFFMLTCR